jgi:hypothetical protein
VKAWVVYAGVSLAAAAGLAAVASLFLSDLAARAVWLAAAVAWILQLAAFAVLVVARRSGTQFFLAGWAAGMMLRFGGLAVLAFLVSRSDALPLDATLVGLVGIVFVLLLIEPLFLRLDTRAT